MHAPVAPHQLGCSNSKRPAAGIRHATVANLVPSDTPVVGSPYLPLAIINLMQVCDVVVRRRHHVREPGLGGRQRRGRGGRPSARLPAAGSPCSGRTQVCFSITFFDVSFE